MPISSGANRWPKSYWTGRPTKTPAPVSVRVISVSERLGFDAMTSAASSHYLRRGRSPTAANQTTSFNWDNAGALPLSSTDPMPNDAADFGIADDVSEEVALPLPPPSSRNHSASHPSDNVVAAYGGIDAGQEAKSAEWSAVETLQVAALEHHAGFLHPSGRGRSRSAVCRDAQASSLRSAGERRPWQWSSRSTARWRPTDDGDDFGDTFVERVDDSEQRYVAPSCGNIAGTAETKGWTRMYGQLVSVHWGYINFA